MLLGLSLKRFWVSKCERISVICDSVPIIYVRGNPEWCPWRPLIVSFLSPSFHLCFVWRGYFYVLFVRWKVALLISAGSHIEALTYRQCHKLNVASICSQPCTHAKCITFRLKCAEAVEHPWRGCMPSLASRCLGRCTCVNARMNTGMPERRWEEIEDGMRDSFLAAVQNWADLSSHDVTHCLWGINFRF